MIWLRSAVTRLPSKRNVSKDVLSTLNMLKAKLLSKKADKETDPELAKRIC